MNPLNKTHGPPEPEGTSIRASQDDSQDEALVHRLHADGAHFVIVDSDKKPTRRRWHRRRPKPERIVRHIKGGGYIGIIPASIGAAVLDVDDGDPSKLMSLYPPSVVTSSPSGGKHLWFHTEKRHRPRTWEMHGCSGDLVCDDSYVVLWDGISCVKTMLQSQRREFPTEQVAAAPRAERGSRHPLDHSSQAQAYRGKRSGESRRLMADIKGAIAKNLVTEGLTQQQVADTLGCTDRTVRNLLTRDVPPVEDSRKAIKNLHRLETLKATDRRAYKAALSEAESNLWGVWGVEVPPTVPATMRATGTAVIELLVMPAAEPRPVRYCSRFTGRPHCRPVPRA